MLLHDVHGVQYCCMPVFSVGYRSCVQLRSVTVPSLYIHSTPLYMEVSENGDPNIVTLNSRIIVIRTLE